MLLTDRQYIYDSIRVFHGTRFIFYGEFSIILILERFTCCSGHVAAAERLFPQPVESKQARKSSTKSIKSQVNTLFYQIKLPTNCEFEESKMGCGLSKDRVKKLLQIYHYSIPPKDIKIDVAF